MPRAISDTLVLAERNLVRFPRSPELLISYTVQPMMFLLLFDFVFGGAISTPGYSYIDFLIPGIIVQSIAFGGFATALGLNDDLHKGLIDRFRSLPMSRAAVLAGRTLSDVITNTLAMTVLLVTGVVIGFTFNASAVDVIAGMVLLLLFGYGFSWVFALAGLLASSAETANSIGFLVIFPLTFVSSAFVPVKTMPTALQDFAKVNPFTIVVDAMRALWIGAPAGQQRLGGLPVVRRDHRRIRAACRLALSRRLRPVDLAGLGSGQPALRLRAGDAPGRRGEEPAGCFRCQAPPALAGTGSVAGRADTSCDDALGDVALAVIALIEVADVDDYRDLAVVPQQADTRMPYSTSSGSGSPAPSRERIRCSAFCLRSIGAMRQSSPERCHRSRQGRDDPVPILSRPGEHRANACHQDPAVRDASARAAPSNPSADE